MESIGVLHVRKTNTEIINSYELKCGENIIGRPSKEKPSTIEIDGDTKLSRQHFIIKVNQNKDETFTCFVRDNDSANGIQIISGSKKKTLTNNEEIRLENKDIIRAGEKFLFELEISTSEEQPTEKIAKPINGRISVPVTGKEGKTEYKIVACEHILYIKADGNYAYLHITDDDEDRVIWANKNLKYFDNYLKDEPYIFRIHDSTIVNINMIEDYNVEGKDGRVTLKNKKMLPVSRTYKDSLEKALNIK